jgi:flagellar FliL protein
MEVEDNKTEELKLETPNHEDDSSFNFSDPYDSIKGKRLYLLIGGLVSLVLIIFAIFYFSGDSGDASSSKETAKAQHKPHTLGYTFDLPEITTNLAPGAGKKTWIKLSVTVQMESSKDQATLDKKLPIVKDGIIVFLREVRAADLSSSGGSMMLKSELIKRINKILYPVQVKDVLLRELILDN